MCNLSRLIIGNYYTLSGRPLGELGVQSGGSYCQRFSPTQTGHAFILIYIPRPSFSIQRPSYKGPSRHSTLLVFSSFPLLISIPHPRFFLPVRQSPICTDRSDLCLKADWVCVGRGAEGGGREGRRDGGGGGCGTLREPVLFPVLPLDYTILVNE